VLKIENRCNGENSFEDYELVLDEELGEFVLRPIANTEQQSMFDDQYQEAMVDAPAMIEEMPFLLEDNGEPGEEEEEEEEEFEELPEDF
jgi:hypothetical protein